MTDDRYLPRDGAVVRRAIETAIRVTSEASYHAVLANQEAARAALETAFGTDGKDGAWIELGGDAGTTWVDESPEHIAELLTEAVSVYEPPAARS